MLELAVFALLSAAITFFTLRRAHDRHAHGLYRFFAFEFILALIVLNAGHWFVDPWSATQVASWLLLLTSATLATFGFNQLRVMGQARGDIENTTRLAQSGLYKYVRHPLYSSLLFLAWGVFLKDPSIACGALALASSAALLATARVEEAENVEKFGREYAQYAARTRMFLPFLF